MRGRAWRAVIPLAVVLALGGCAGSPAVPTPSPTISHSPASEEAISEALEFALQTYLATIDTIGAEGGERVDRVQDMVAPEVLEQHRRDAGILKSNGWRTEGTTSFDTLELQTASSGIGGIRVINYVCLDVSHVRVIDSSGSDVTPPERENRLPLEQTWVGSALEELVLESSQVWQGDNFC
ncbi:MAG TPA: hypothetical protein VIL55_11010 [Naasia sp.]